MAAGVRSLLAFWAGGAGAIPATTQAGVRSMLAPWMGGASASPDATTQAGVRSLLAYWMGGASSALTDETPSGGGGGRGYVGSGNRPAPNAERLFTRRVEDVARVESGPDQATSERAAIAAAEAQYNAANVQALVEQLAAARATGLPAKVQLPSGRILDTAAANDDDTALLMFALYLAMDDD